jgi:hypothetical protein
MNEDMGCVKIEVNVVVEGVGSLESWILVLMLFGWIF